MNAQSPYLNQSPVDIAQKLAEIFALTAAERDRQGGNPKAERDLIRQSGLLGLSIQNSMAVRRQIGRPFLKLFKL